MQLIVAHVTANAGTSFKTQACKLALVIAHLYGKFEVLTDEC